MNLPDLKTTAAICRAVPHTPIGGGGAATASPHLPDHRRTSGAAGTADRTSAFAAIKRRERELRARVRELEVALLVKDGEIKGLKEALGAQADGTRGGE